MEAIRVYMPLVDTPCVLRASHEVWKVCYTATVVLATQRSAHTYIEGDGLKLWGAGCLGYTCFSLGNEMLCLTGTFGHFKMATE